MANTNEAANSKSTANQVINMPPLHPQNTIFALLEAQLKAANITNDKVKFVTLAKCIENRLR